MLSIMGNGFSVVSSNRRGRPDIMGHIGLVGLFIEVKVKKDKLSPQQRATLCNINDKGGIGIVVHEKHLDVFKSYVDKIIYDIATHKPISIVGKPIPPELEVKPFDLSNSMSAEAI